MAEKFISLVGGMHTEKQATTVSAGAADAGKVVGLDSGGLIDPSLLPSNVGSDASRSILAFEDLVSGNYVNIFEDTGVTKVRKADATNGRLALGFVKSGATAGAAATVFTYGVNNQHVGLLSGVPMFLSITTPGAGTSVVPTGTGNLSQMLGYSLSQTEVLFEFNPFVTLA